MKIAPRTLVIIAVLGAFSPGQSATPQRKHILVIGEEKGYRHESVSHAMATVERLGTETGLWDSTIRTDAEALTKKKLEYNAKNLNNFDAVFFFTGGDLEMDAQQKSDLLSFIHEDGKGFIGIHSAAITFVDWPEYGEMIGGYYDEHPWGTFDAPIVVEDPAFPGMQQWPKSFVLHDEIYQMRNYSRDKVRVLMRLDAAKIDVRSKNVHRTDRDFAVTWARMYGKGPGGCSPSVGRTLEHRWRHRGRWAFRILRLRHRRRDPQTRSSPETRAP
jgi:type 1 glutamine amidotransferase